MPAAGSGSPPGVTFGSFNHPLKFTPRVVACWSRILHRLPQARLVLKYRGLDDPDAQARLWKLFAGEGIAARRVELSGGCSHDEFLGWYNRIDIALDPFPYGGGLTTCEALWMGVPVVTCPGETFASRHSLSHLSNVGLTETIAGDLDEYVELAVSLAEDLPRLAALRAGAPLFTLSDPFGEVREEFAAPFDSIILDVRLRATTTPGEWVYHCGRLSPDAVSS